ncbi:cytochrome c oxidase subunit I [Methylocystis echinoides]|uniref:cytochrome c oxidase subunit I n=1 Tax=Methylocystis echinoides TaxID=29468 RepID=UPI00343437C0
MNDDAKRAPAPPSRTAPPNETPRPEAELAALTRAWALPRGWRRLSEINNSVVGIVYIGAAFLFFLLAGVLALMMRVQLAQGDNRFIGQELYNQIFTMHGTTMMFLFAVPAMEALGVLLLPQMLAARDLPFPRLSAYAVWAYVIGGLVFFSTIFYDLAPDGGWFMYPPLTLREFSPGDNADFWLLGIGFIEISAIAGAIEIIVGVLRTRPPGMTLDKLPIFAWSMLIFAGMIVFAFPAIILATLLLEIERAFGWPFFSAARGGDPLLWQHLFWFFGHPEVYIIFLPAAGLVSMIAPTMAQRPLAGYRLIVIALIATGFFSFGLWVHHMFATGIPALSLGFFSAASMAVAVPSGIQVFSWIATIASGNRRFIASTPSLFIIGLLVIFTIGGLTGVMVAVVPFDFQAHDTYFVIAHLHYVLVGGMVFPLFAAFYYWEPLFGRGRLSERLGRIVFSLMFVGFNVAFFPMHIAGLMGMPRRVWTYASDRGWDTLNMISTVGAFVFAAGVALFLIDLLIEFRSEREIRQHKANPWNAGTLEWAPSDLYSVRSIPFVRDRYPLWENPGLAKEIEAGAWWLPGTATGRRETIVTAPLDGEPEYLLEMPGPGWAHVFAAIFTAAFFLLLTVKAVTLALICGVLAILSTLVWCWQLDPPPGKKRADIGGGVTLSTYVSGPQSHSWWAMIVLIFVAASLYLTYVFSYLYLWTVNPSVWPAPGGPQPPTLDWPAAAGALLVIGSALFVAADRLLPPPGGASATPLFLVAGAACLVAGVGAELFGHWQAGLRPWETSYGALVYVGGLLTGQLALVVFIMAGFVVARYATGQLDARRRVTFESTALFAYYTSAQGLLGLLLLHGFPRLLE